MIEKKKQVLPKRTNKHFLEDATPDFHIGLDHDDQMIVFEARPQEKTNNEKEVPPASIFYEAA